MRSLFFSLLVVVGVVCCDVRPAVAEVLITSDPGGEVSSFLRKYEYIRARGEHVTIDGQCLSACTLLLAVLPKRQMCATSRAVLGFHAASYYDDQSRTLVPTKEGTRLVMNLYPAGIRSWINSQGGLTTRILSLKGAELSKFIPPCR